MKPTKKAKELVSKYKEFIFSPKDYTLEQCLIEMHEWTKQQMIKRACKQFKILINFFDSNKEFNADKFCEEWKKDIEEEL